MLYIGGNSNPKLNPLLLPNHPMDIPTPELDFINGIPNDKINFRLEQPALIAKAHEISGGNKLSALEYIVTSLCHVGAKPEFELVFVIPPRIHTTINLPIIETEPPDELGYYVIWGNKTITHNTPTYVFEPADTETQLNVRFFGMGISGFGSTDSGYYNSYLTQVISFGLLGHRLTSFAYAFYRCVNLQKIDPGLPSTITNLEGMFSYCTDFNLKLLWDVSNVINMKDMFNNCKKFNQILQWDVSNVTNMEGMFDNCNEYNQAIPWDTSSVSNMKQMFFNCHNFNQELNWDTSNVQDMESMFCTCSNFNQSLQWNTKKVKSMAWMFARCEKFNQPLVLNTEACTNMHGMFYNCKNFNQELKWVVSNVVSMEYMFYYCVNFNSPLSWDTSKVENMRSMFSQCVNFNKPLLLDVSSAKVMDFMFSNCKKFNQDLKWGMSISNIVSMEGMFYSCQNFDKQLDWVVPKQTNVKNMFKKCAILKKNKPQSIEFAESD